MNYKILVKNLPYWRAGTDSVGGSGMDGVVIGLGGKAPLNFFFLNITILIGINFSNFVQ